MIAICDTGGSKGDWVLVPVEGPEIPILTAGFNPFTHDPKTYEMALQEAFSKLRPDQVMKVYYYGAGVRELSAKEKVHSVLIRVFPQAEITIEVDLVASARATCQRSKGIACILGTGANSCLYDGSSIVDNIRTLGYLAGDEGSGAHFGKLLVKAYFYRDMPPDLRSAFDQKYPGSYENILNRLYHEPAPNQFLGSFTHFAAEWRSHPFVQQLLTQNFQDFIDSQVSKYADFQSVPIHFVGSMAYHFKEILEKVLVRYNARLGTVIARPLEKLIQFHRHAYPI
jgi:glucosamine kinase